MMVMLVEVSSFCRSTIEKAKRSLCFRRENVFKILLNVEFLL